MLYAAVFAKLHPCWEAHGADKEFSILHVSSLHPSSVSNHPSSIQRYCQLCPAQGQGFLTCTARCPHRSQALSAPALQAESNCSPHSRQGDGNRRSGAHRQHILASGCEEGRCTAPSPHRRDVSHSHRLQETKRRCVWKSKSHAAQGRHRPTEAELSSSAESWAAFLKLFQG